MHIIIDSYAMLSHALSYYMHIALYAYSTTLEEVID